MAASNLLPIHIRGNSSDAIAELRQEIRYNAARKDRARRARLARLASAAALGAVLLMFAGLTIAALLIVAPALANGVTLILSI